MQKILILGGTKFIGRNLVESLLQNSDFELTIFNRGQSGSELFPKIKRIIGSRETDAIAQIGATNWDYVIDCSCYLPADLESTLAHLSDSIKKYIFISTCSAYDNLIDKSILRNENAPLSPCSTEQRIEKTLKGYGNKKAECERILTKSGVPHSILRPSLTFGAYDYTDRFYYWLYQVKTADKLLLPETGEMKISITYVKDLVRVIERCLETKAFSETYNVMSYPMISIAEIVDCTAQILQKKLNISRASADFLLENKVQQWNDLPLWLNLNFFNYSNKKMLDNLGVKPTPLRTAIEETLAYHDTLDWERPIAGMKEERKEKLLQLLKNQ